MFEDILNHEKETHQNLRVVCPYCGTTILEVTWREGESYIIKELDRQCRKCGGDTAK